MRRDMENYVEICGQVENGFSWKRLQNVARWDLAVNRTFYLRVSALMACTVIIPVLYYYISVLYVTFTTEHGLYMNFFNVKEDHIGSVSEVILGLGFLGSMVLMGYMFHGLLTRQSRINELTLPATNAERFLWNVLRTVVGSWLVFWVSVCVADVLHLLMGCVLGQTGFQSLTWEVWKNVPDVVVNSESTQVMLLFGLVCCLTNAITYSLFALGNAWKYKNNIAQTVVFMVAFGTLQIILVMFFATYLTVLADNDSAKEILQAIDYLFNQNEGQNAEFVLSILLGALAAVEMLVLALMWWITYRLYCRAQITTKRNP